jgi:hypothetical protein
MLQPDRRDAMTEPAAAPRKLIITTPKSLIVVMIVVFVSIVAVGIGSVLYSNYVARESNRKWCGIVTTLDDAYTQSPAPTMPVGKRIAIEMKELRRDFGC